MAGFSLVEDSIHRDRGDTAFILSIYFEDKDADPHISQVATKALGCTDASDHTLAKEYLSASRLDTALEDPIAVFATTKKYKPVALKTKPVIDQLPPRFRIVREIKGDPLRDLPVLPENPSMFIPTARYSQERKEIIDKIHEGEFL